MMIPQSDHQQENPLDATEGGPHLANVDDPEDVNQRLRAWLAWRLLDARARTHAEMGERLYRLWATQL